MSGSPARVRSFGVDRIEVLAWLPPMFSSSRPKVIKRCPQGHPMQMSWRTCPKCTGRAPAAVDSARDMTEQTMIFGAPPVARPEPEPVRAPDWVALLAAATGPEAGRKVEITPGRWKLGKQPREEEGFQCVTIRDGFMSRDHFALEAGVAAVILRDLGSTNGTFVGTDRIERHILREGDTIRAGETTFRVSLAPRVSAP